MKEQEENCKDFSEEGRENESIAAFLLSLSYYDGVLPKATFVFQREPKSKVKDD